MQIIYKWLPRVRTVAEFQFAKRRLNSPEKKNMATFTLYLALWSLSVTTVFGQSSSTIVLRPADSDVAASQTLPLSCVATANGAGSDSPTFTWKRRNETTGQVSNVAVPPVNQMYRSTDNVDFVISTLILCNMGFGDAGTYICNASGSTIEESIRVSVHVPTSANFQLRFSGVGHCGTWTSSRDLTTTVDQITQHLQDNVLNSICTQACNYTITNGRFDCAGDPNSDSVTFLATLNHQRSSETLGQSAGDLVNGIGTWKDSSDTIVVSSQSLRVDPGCDVTASSTCGRQEDGGQSLIGPIVGGAVGGVVVVIILVVLIAVIIALVVSRSGKSKKDSTEVHELHSNRAYEEVTRRNPSYGVSKALPAIPNNEKNAAYEKPESVHYYTAMDRGEGEAQYDYIN